MNFRHSKVLVTALLAAIMIAPALLAQTSTSGAIEGRVTDSSGAPLPGVTIEIQSPQLQGTKTEVTDSRGMFRFSLLPPGTYSLSTSLSGFSPTRQGNINVALSRVVTLDVRVSSAVVEKITVTAAAPVVDVTTASVGANVTAQTMQSLPLGRNYVNAAQVAPGTATDNVGTTFYGSSGAENQYIIDGLNTTGVRSGDQQKSVNLDFIQEVEVKTGGMPAEYGRMTGGAINAITKSGGNQFTGDLLGFDSPKSLRANNTTFNNRSVLSSDVLETNKNLFDYGLDIGGYFVKDRIWFFGAYDRQDRTDVTTIINAPIALPNYQVPIGGNPPDAKVKSNLYAGKLTLRASDNQNVTLSLFGDPNTTTGRLFPVAGPPSTFAGSLKSGGNDYIGHYAGVFGTNFVANAEVGQHQEKNTYAGDGTTIVQLRDQTVSPAVNTGGFAFFENETYKRRVYKADLSNFISTHEIKVGGDFEDLKANIANFYGGGQLIYKLTFGNTVRYRHRYYVNDLASGFKLSDPTTWQLLVPEIAAPQTKNTSAYAQDSWKILQNFTVNAGVRWESQEVIGRNNVKAFKINNNWAPRIGAIWDVTNNGRSKLYANYGRFFEAIPMDINIRSFGGELVCFCYNFSPDPANPKPDPTAGRSSLLGNGIEPVDPNLKGQRIDEMLLGYDQEVGPNLAIGIQGTYRKLVNVIEDMLIPSTGGYLIANPGSGIGREAGFVDGGTAITPAAKRTYKGVEIHAVKHFSENTQFYASYLWSRLEGNYDGTNQVSTGQLDPNINSAFDYADFIVNNSGLLSNDRTHQVKFYGSYMFTNGAMNGLNIGLATHYYSGTPLTAFGYSAAYANWEYYLTKRGALGRGPADYEADLHFGYPIKTGAARVNLIADVFNVLNLQRNTSLDLRYNRPQDASCIGFVVPSGKTMDDVCTSDNGLKTQPGTVIPVGTIDPSKAPNPSFLKAGRGFTNPRIFRLGVRLSF